MAPLNETREGHDARRDSEELGHEITKLLAKLGRTVQVAGLANDPIFPLLDLILSSLKLQWRLHNQAVRYFHDASDRLDRQYQETIRKADLAVQQAGAALQAKQAGIVEQLAPALAAAVDMAVREHVKIVRFKTVAGWSATVLGLGLLACLFTYPTGFSAGLDRGVQSKDTILSAVQGSSESAADWATLIQNNDAVLALKACRRNLLTSDDGRSYCLMPVWLEPRPAGHQAPG